MNSNVKEKAIWGFLGTRRKKKKTRKKAKTLLAWEFWRGDKAVSEQYSENQLQR